MTTPSPEECGMLPEAVTQPRWMDQLGAALAGLCAVHCIALSFGSLVLGVAAAGFLASPFFRWPMMLAAFNLVVVSLFHARTWPDWKAATLLVAGLAAVVCANLDIFSGVTHQVLSICGGLALAAGHLRQLARAQRPRSPYDLHRSPRGDHSMRFVLALFAAGSLLMLVPPHACRVLPESTEPPGGHIVSWDVLAQLDSESGKLGADLSKAVNRTVRVPGFVVPLDDAGKTFLLSPHPGGCLHGPDDGANQIILVTMQETAKPIDPWTFEPVWVTGVLQVEAVDSPFGAAAFQMRGLATEIYQ